ncbi:MAG TPA: pyridoxal-phosphate dependent enzyme, partial [Longimicrobiaceae bacterium]|nr:pyridoxal-phosphate dependent enzyme [Longimicrobiaceae bacterium]
MRAETITGTDLPTITDVLQAARRVAGIVRHTPLEPSPTLSEAAGTEVFLKLENLQRTGAFKLRGAVNALAALGPEERARGVVTASAGNHGVGVSWAAGTLGIPATVFVPATAAATKRRRIARFGALLREIPGGYDEAHHAGEAHAEETGKPFINAFSDPLV